MTTDLVAGRADDAVTGRAIPGARPNSTIEAVVKREERR
jgi:hypothetical protein